MRDLIDQLDQIIAGKAHYIQYQMDTDIKSIQIYTKESEHL
jgi:hypothetical protein